MPVRLRLSLHGYRNNRIFHLVATDLRKRRDAKPIELLGIYDPRLGAGQEHKTMQWSVERILYWLEKGGAQPSKPVVKLLEKGGIIPPNSKYHPRPSSPSNPPAGSSEASPPPRPPLP
ncbi:ribosomal protein S16 domain-containing protein [Lactarius hatsudake]|nr:ribosomal protein S16 domain-containing protein [Lactarius hatsudake]